MSARIAELIEVTVCEGSGTVADPYRTVTYYYDLDGSLLAVDDPAQSAARSPADG